jgi:hypothetical protein
LVGVEGGAAFVAGAEVSGAGVALGVLLALKAFGPEDVSVDMDGGIG